MRKEIPADPANKESRPQVTSLEIEVTKIEEKEDESNALEGLKFVISGVFENYERSELKKLIEQHGGKNVSSLSKNTSYLIAGNNMGPSKKDKAAKLNIPMISEFEFEKMING